MKMRAMQLMGKQQQLTLTELPIPEPIDNQVLLKIKTCGVCRTDLHILDGELDNPTFPITPGHQIIGEVTKLGSAVTKFKLGQRLGVPWLGHTCGCCSYCIEKQENLCDDAKFTGFNINGGFAEYCVAHVDYCFPIPDNYTDIQAAPLLCAGLIGYRSFNKLPAQAQKIGIYGFGAAAHIITQIASYFGKEIYAFTKDGDIAAQTLALRLGAKWVGGISEQAPLKLDGAIIFAPAGELVPIALRAVHKGGCVVCAGIHMTDIPSFPYQILWGERTLFSIANLTIKDGSSFMDLISKINIQTETHSYSLSQANQALDDLRNGRYVGAGVIVM